MSNFTTAQDIELAAASEKSLPDHFRPLSHAGSWGLLFSWIALTDWAIYRGGGWGGWAVVFALIPLFVFCAPRERVRIRESFWLLSVLLLVVATKLLWSGAPHVWMIAIGLVFGAVLAAHGIVPYIHYYFFVHILMLVGLLKSIFVSIVAISDRSLHPRSNAKPFGWQFILGAFFPCVAIALFGGLFILANPNFRIAFDEYGHWITRSIEQWIRQLDEIEILFWGITAPIGLGLMFPYVERLVRYQCETFQAPTRAMEARPSIYFLAARNTLWAVILLFGCYLIYEFGALWFRSFPVGFYYAGYAHEGAFWLTVALGMSTCVLSMIFCRSMRADSRLDTLKWLAWIWSMENLLLALAVYNRLFIYIDFNGMTRMRLIGIIGMTTVVVGFVWVLVKIIKNREFAWLIHRHLWTLACAFLLYALLPVDWLVHQYNANAVIHGKRSPSVQMIAHETRSEGMLPLLSLIDCEDEEIREGIRAMAASWSADLDTQNVLTRDWSRFQIADWLLYQKLQSIEVKLQDYRDADSRQLRLKRFYDYAYQWY